jgi:hypothetical protein
VADGFGVGVFVGVAVGMFVDVGEVVAVGFGDEVGVGVLGAKLEVAGEIVSD